MKKVILLVASVLAALQSIANRNVGGTNANPLILSPSDGVYYHGSHASHASHSSHYSMSISTKVDSLSNARHTLVNYLLEGLAKDHKVSSTQIKIKHIYISNKYDVSIKQYTGVPSIILNGNDKCVYIDFYINGFDYINGNLIGHAYEFHYEYIIPLSNTKQAFLVNHQTREMEKKNKTKWMYNLFKVSKQ